MRTLGILLVLVALLAGCAAPAAPASDDASIEAESVMPAVEPFLLELKGHTVTGVIDQPNHAQPFETVIFNVQQAGWNVKIDEVPQAIEVRVDWKGEGAFTLHPHFYKGDDASGQTIYYGYHSQQFTTGTGCIRLTDADMAAGVWPMMVHPSAETQNMPFTITVGILGAEGVLMDDLHGHRADMNFDIQEHEIGECQFLGK